jgi:hypothetical protein
MFWQLVNAQEGSEVCQVKPWPPATADDATREIGGRR